MFQTRHKCNNVLPKLHKRSQKDTFENFFSNFSTFVDFFISVMMHGALRIKTENIKTNVFYFDISDHNFIMVVNSNVFIKIQLEV